MCILSVWACISASESIWLFQIFWARLSPPCIGYRALFLEKCILEIRKTIRSWDILVANLNVCCICHLIKRTYVQGFYILI
jgi:hypothetical protein